ncbi:hypothetical protein F5X68DRAFT_227927 [Plectosphaerella plurivora]|uniref:Lysine-specific metallo-endopeptidase domain-containing protein n=1 Tax=Plectosphaerella plurivora TaxID=936078 RepID=A0A9P8VIV6_9PEZI|nr:hypothetical protein F5X68DRAFT_227927 [Plectosphaerella plurivora]
MTRYSSLLLLSAGVAYALPRSSLGWLLQRDIASVFVVTGSPSYGCTPEEIASLDQGVTDAVTLAQAAIGGLASPDVVTSPAFVDWLGATNGPRRTAISSVFGGVASNLLNPGQGAQVTTTVGRGVNDLVYVCPKGNADADCAQGNVIAWALGHDGTTRGNWIALCPLFFDPRQMGTLAQSQAAFSQGRYQDCFGLTLLHEATHQAEIVGQGADTDDHSYDLAEMKLLPDNRKIDNAESLAIFALDALANPERLRPASCPAPPRNQPRFLDEREHPRMMPRQAQGQPGDTITITENGTTRTETLTATLEQSAPATTTGNGGGNDPAPPPPQPTPTQPDQPAPPPADPPAPTTTDDNNGGGGVVPPPVPPPAPPPAPPVVPPVPPGGGDPPQQPTNEPTPTTTDPPCSTAPPFNPTGQRPTDVIKNPAAMAAILALMDAEGGGGGGGGGGGTGTGTGTAQPTDPVTQTQQTGAQQTVTVTQSDGTVTTQTILLDNGPAPTA